jgi:hypothetical protein
VDRSTILCGGILLHRSSFAKNVRQLECRELLLLCRNRAFEKYTQVSIASKIKLAMQIEDFVLEEFCAGAAGRAMARISTSDRIPFRHTRNCVWSGQRLITAG